jgi:hypothetical protein
VGTVGATNKIMADCSDVFENPRELPGKINDEGIGATPNAPLGVGVTTLEITDKVTLTLSKDLLLVLVTVIAKT